MLLRKVRLRVNAGSAKPGPAIGQALGPLGLNMADFCKQFNERTKFHLKDVPLPVLLSAFNNRTFEFQVKTPPVTWFIKRCAGIEKGATRPGHETVGKIHVKQIYEIGLMKQQDPALARLELEQVCKCIVGSCESMGVECGHPTIEIAQTLPPLQRRYMYNCNTGEDLATQRIEAVAETLNRTLTNQ